MCAYGCQDKYSSLPCQIERFEAWYAHIYCHRVTAGNLEPNLLYHEGK